MLQRLRRWWQDHLARFEAWILRRTEQEEDGTAWDKPRRKKEP